MHLEEELRKGYVQVRNSSLPSLFIFSSGIIVVAVVPVTVLLLLLLLEYTYVKLIVINRTTPAQSNLPIHTIHTRLSNEARN